MPKQSSNPPPEKVLLFSRDNSLIGEVKPNLTDNGYTVITKTGVRGFRNAVKQNPGIMIVLDGDCESGNGMNHSKEVINYLSKIHNDRVGAYGAIVLSRRKTADIGQMSGYLGGAPIITRGNIIQLNGEWKNAWEQASEKREELEHKIKRLSIGIVGYGRVGRAFIHSSVSGEGESFDIKVTSRDTKGKARGDIEENYQRRKSRCNVEYFERLEDVLDGTDMIFTTFKHPHGQRPSASRDWCWDQNATASEKFGKMIQGYNGLVICVTNLPEVNTYLIREAGNLENNQVIALGNVDADRVDKYANYDSARKSLNLSKGAEIYDCFVFGAHDTPVPGFSLMRAKSIKGGLICNSSAAKKFERFVRRKMKELPEYIIEHKGDTDGTTGFAMTDVAKAVYSNDIVTLGMAYPGDSDRVPLQRPCVIKRKEGDLLRAYPTSHRPSDSEIKEILDARKKVISYLVKFGKNMPQSRLDPRFL